MTQRDLDIHNSPEFQAAMDRGDTQAMADLSGDAYVLEDGSVVDPRIGNGNNQG